jgi:predicted ester cyclase
VVEDQLAEGDRVGTRFTARGTHAGSFLGIPATGKAIAVEGIAIDRFAAGKLVESWLVYDRLGLLQQLGAVPGGLPAPSA